LATGREILADTILKLDCPMKLGEPFCSWSKK